MIGEDLLRAVLYGCDMAGLPGRSAAGMIDLAVSLVARRLNQHLRQQFGAPEDLVAVTGLTDGEGKPTALSRNRIAVFVTNITEETGARRAPARAGMIGGRVAVSAEPVYLNIYLMIASSYDAENYLESLKILSRAVQFFQSVPVFDHQNSPDMDDRLHQLALEIHNMDADTSSQLWGTHGGRYVPSVQYKMRLVAIGSGAVLREDFVIRQPDIAATPVAEGAR